MLRKNKMDPTRINNYNKFLITLDKSPVYNLETNCTKNDKTENKEEDIKSNLDKIIEKITLFNDEYKKEHPKKQPRNLLILDDCIHFLPSSTQHSSINQIFVNGRHMRLSTFICSQMLTKLNRLIRTNADLVTFFPTDNKREFETMSDEWSIEPKLLRNIYEFAINGNNSFLHISFCGRKPVFFKKFDRIVIE